MLHQARKTDRFNQFLFNPRFAVAIASCLLISTPAVAAQLSVNGAPVGQKSILIHDDNPQPTASSFRSRPSEDASAGNEDRLAPNRNAFSVRPGFEIPPSPTVADFTNTQASEPTGQAQQGSDARGTFAHPVRDEQDEFAAPAPPAWQQNPSGATTATVRVTPSDLRDEENGLVNPNTHNGLRSRVANPEPDEAFGKTPPVVRSTRPVADSLTADRFADADPAPRAVMPSAKNSRFNSQLFSGQPAKPQALPVAQPPLVRRQPIQRPAQSAPIVDNNIATTSYTTAAAGSESQENLAKQIVDRYSMDNAPDPLPGEPMSLEQMLQQPLPTQNRQPMVSQYWETWFDWASTQNAIAYKEWLSSIPQASSRGDRGLLDAARSAADNEVLAAEIQLGKSQAKLLRFMPTRRSNLNPLPSDLPLVERYETHYELYRSRNLLPAKLTGIDQMLPRTLELIQSRAKTVQMSQAAIKQTLSAYQNRQTPLASVLEAARVWRVSEKDLLASVTNYNQAIADYAMNITRQYTTPEQTAAMLIGAPKTKTETPPMASPTSTASTTAFSDRRPPSSPTNAFGSPRANRSALSSARTASTTPPRGASRSTGPSIFGDRQAKTAPPAQSTRPTWGGASASSRPKPPTSSSSLGADGRPSLNTASRSTAGNTSSAFGSLSAGPSPKRPAAGSSRSSLGNRNLFEESSKPTRTPPKRTTPTRTPASDNSFGFGS